jgi:luciferase family oxidoreductase group 1
MTTTLSIPVSVLDIAMIERGKSSSEALRATVDLSRRAEALGYHRFWVAEHHRTAASASSAPAVLIAQIAATTERMRVGSGGVMLTNHAPLAVAEEFAVLRALHPGRVDAGVGRGPGTYDAEVVRALRRGAPPPGAEEYPRSVTELLDFMAQDGTEGIWLLSSSGEGARLAARLGLPMVAAHHIRPDKTAEVVEHYRRGFRPSRWLEHPYVMVSVTTVCADTDEQAELLARPAFRFFAEVVSGRGKDEPFSSVSEMAARDLTEEEQATANLLTRFQAIGGPVRVAERLADIATTFGADELMVSTPVFDLDDRIRSIELVARQLAGDHTGSLAVARSEAPRS